ncbi:MAG: hypothetical protein ACR2LR_00630 [Hassallia sp.]
MNGKYCGSCDRLFVKEDCMNFLSHAQSQSYAKKTSNNEPHFYAEFTEEKALLPFLRSFLTLYL